MFDKITVYFIGCQHLETWRYNVSHIGNRIGHNFEPFV